MKTLTIRVPDSVFDSLADRAESEKSTLADLIRSILSTDLSGSSNAAIFKSTSEIMTEIKALRADLAAVE